MRTFMIAQWPPTEDGKVEGVEAPDIHRVPTELAKRPHHKGKQITPTHIDGQPGLTVNNTPFRIFDVDDDEELQTFSLVIGRFCGLPNEMN